MGGYSSDEKIDIPNDRIACGHAIGQLVFTWEGQAVNCGFDGFAQHIWGDVSKESIKDIWERRNEQMVKNHIAHRFDLIPEICRHCNNWRNIGEDRFDQNGNRIVKNYSEREKMMI